MREDGTMKLSDIMDKVTSGRLKIYLHEEDGKWFTDGCLLDRVEVDLDQLFNNDWFVILCADSELVLIREACA